MSLRIGGFCKTGRHLLGPDDIGTNGDHRNCRVCHRELMRRRRGTAGQAGCAICGRVEPRNGCRDGLCKVCRPEVVLLNRQYVALSQERRRGRMALRTTCPEGHPFTAENTVVSAGRVGRAQVSRRCRLCELKRWRRQRQQAKVRAFRGLVGELGRAA